jgi:hypothetical protein
MRSGMNRLPSRLFALLALAALAPMAACGSDDDDTTSATDAGTDSSTGSSQDGGSGLDATSSADAGGHPDSGNATLDASSEDGATSDADAASKPCTPVNGTYTLNGPGAGSQQLCPTATAVVCHFATAAGSCALTSQCASADGGSGTGFFAIPSGTLDGNDTLTYSTAYAIPVVGDFTAACSLSFTSNQTVATLVCSGSVALEGTVSCSYSGTDAL